MYTQADLAAVQQQLGEQFDQCMQANSVCQRQLGHAEQKIEMLQQSNESKVGTRQASSQDRQSRDYKTRKQITHKQTDRRTETVRIL